MTMTFSSSNVIDGTTVGTTATLVLPTDVPAGATIVVGIANRTDETTAISSVADPVNGTWPATPQGPIDMAGSEVTRVWLYYFVNSAALSGAANRTITITFGASITHASVAGWASDDAGAQ